MRASGTACRAAASITHTEAVDDRKWNHPCSCLAQIAAPPLSHDQPLGPAAEVVIASAVAALEQGEAHYGEVGGIAPLVKQLKGLVGAEPPGVLVIAGVQETRFLAIHIVGDQLGGAALPAVVKPGAPRAAKLYSLSVAIS